MLPSSGSAFDVRQFANPDRHDSDLAKRHFGTGRPPRGHPKLQDDGELHRSRGTSHESRLALKSLDYVTGFLDQEMMGFSCWGRARHISFFLTPPEYEEPKSGLGCLTELQRPQCSALR